MARETGMLFDTPVYFLFLVLVVIAYWRLPFRRQNVLLLACSYFFYGWWDWRFLFLMGTSTIVDYFLALKIAHTGDPVKRRVYLIISLENSDDPETRGFWIRDGKIDDAELDIV